MSVRVELKQRHGAYTNFDFVEGRVFLSIVQQETVGAITVKLEGESRTRLAGVVNPRGQYDGFQKDQTQLEVHKVCRYDLVTAVLTCIDPSTAPLRRPSCLSHTRYRPSIVETAVHFNARPI